MEISLDGLFQLQLLCRINSLSLSLSVSLVPTQLRYLAATISSPRLSFVLKAHSSQRRKFIKSFQSTSTKESTMADSYGLINVQRSIRKQFICPAQQDYDAMLRYRWIISVRASWMTGLLANQNAVQRIPVIDCLLDGWWSHSALLLLFVVVLSSWPAVDINWLIVIDKRSELWANNGSWRVKRGWRGVCAPRFIKWLSCGGG